jgi:hypothetical protein
MANAKTVVLYSIQNVSSYKIRGVILNTQYSENSDNRCNKIAQMPIDINPGSRVALLRTDKGCDIYTDNYTSGYPYVMNLAKIFVVADDKQVPYDDVFGRIISVAVANPVTSRFDGIQNAYSYGAIDASYKGKSLSIFIYDNNQTELSKNYALMGHYPVVAVLDQCDAHRTMYSGVCDTNITLEP